MGAVYKAVDTELGRDVALKILAPEMAAKPVMLERFRREARHCAQLRSENIVSIYEFGEDRGHYFLALEYVDGIDLHEYIKRKGQLDPEESRQIIMQAVKALAHVHKQRIVHRDIKPANFLVTRQNGRLIVKLTDLGLARQTRDEDFRVTRAGTTVGTADYMSPEQARDSSAADARSDLYSLGCTWYHLLAGRPPFAEGSLMERIYKHIEAEPVDIRQLNPKVPEAMAAVLRRMLAKKPSDRYPSPIALLRALERFNEGARESDRPLIPTYPGQTAHELPAASTKSNPAVPARPSPRPHAPDPPRRPRAPQRRPRLEEEAKAREAARLQAMAPAWPWWPWILAACGALLVTLLVGTILLVRNLAP
jgi:serine/threonine-protein kinase